MSLLPILLVLSSPDGTPPDSALYQQLEDSVPKTTLRQAPGVPAWPRGLPNPLILQIGDRLGDRGVDVPATCYPAPTDFVLDYFLLHFEVYPGQCQRKLNAAWWAYDSLLAETKNFAEKKLVVLPEEHGGEFQTWVVVLATTGAAIIGALLGYIAGEYL